MVSVFNLEQLQSLMKDFYAIAGIRITVFDKDLRELVSYPERCPDFCNRIRATREGSAACIRCDREACARAARQNGTYLYRCHAGLTEAIVPLYVGNVLVGYLLFGHVFPYDSLETGWEVIRERCKKYPVDLEKLKVSCAALPRVSREYVRSAARILHATASYLVLERMATLQPDSAAARLDEYLEAHYTENLTVQSLCQELGIGRTRLYKLAEQLYGCGISQQVRKLRMERARKLLLDRPDLSITQIAAECGYSDYNYFIAVFSRTWGTPPNQFRKNGK